MDGLNEISCSRISLQSVQLVFVQRRADWKIGLRVDFNNAELRVLIETSGFTALHHDTKWLSRRRVRAELKREVRVLGIAELLHDHNVLETLNKSIVTARPFVVAASTCR